jgi:hypothetical protein
MAIRDPSVPSKSPNSVKIITDSTRILHTLESRVPIDLHPQLVPCTSDTVAYQKHVYYTALLDEVLNNNSAFNFVIVIRILITQNLKNFR